MLQAYIHILWRLFNLNWQKGAEYGKGLISVKFGNCFDFRPQVNGIIREPTLLGPSVKLSQIMVRILRTEFNIS
jgi:hypothetical protein